MFFVPLTPDTSKTGNEYGNHTYFELVNLGPYGESAVFTYTARSTSALGCDIYICDCHNMIYKCKRGFHFHSHWYSLQAIRFLLSQPGFGQPSAKSEVGEISLYGTIRQTLAGAHNHSAVHNEKTPFLCGANSQRKMIDRSCKIFCI